MSVNRLVVTAVVVEGRSKSEVARAYGLSRRWVHELVRRYLQEGDAALTPRSRRPATNPARTPDTVEQRIVELRKSLTDQGLDAGAATIAWHLEREHLDPPSHSTIWRILTRRGFVTPQPRKRPKSSLVRFEADQPNERWQADITHWPLADGTDVEICNIIDDHSRLAVAAACLPVFKAADIAEVFAHAYQHYGLPASVLTDNGAVFTANYRGHGQTCLEKQCATLGIRLHHGRAYHPQTQGKVERFHQTEKRWLARQPPAADPAALQTQLDAFRVAYNHNRPHRALARRTPHEAYTARPAAAPTPSLTQPHYRLRHDKVNSGSITLRHNSRLHHIGLRAAHNGTTVLVLVADLHIRVITTDGNLLRELTLDPTRDYQPRGVKPGPKPRDKPAPTKHDVARHL